MTGRCRSWYLSITAVWGDDEANFERLRSCLGRSLKLPLPVSEATLSRDCPDKFHRLPFHHLPIPRSHFKTLRKTIMKQAI